MLYTINYDTVKASADTHPLIVNLIEMKGDRLYFPIGMWLKALSTDQINELQMICVEAQNATDVISEPVVTLTLLAMILAEYEGLDLNTEDEIRRAIGVLVLIIYAEWMQREGQITIDYDRMTLSCPGA